MNKENSDANLIADLREEITQLRVRLSESAEQMVCAAWLGYDVAAKRGFTIEGAQAMEKEEEDIRKYYGPENALPKIDLIVDELIYPNAAYKCTLHVAEKERFTYGIHSAVGSTIAGGDIGNGGLHMSLEETIVEIGDFYRRCDLKVPKIEDFVPNRTRLSAGKFLPFCVRRDGSTKTYEVHACDSYDAIRGFELVTRETYKRAVGLACEFARVVIRESSGKPRMVP